MEPPGPTLAPPGPPDPLGLPPGWPPPLWPPAPPPAGEGERVRTGNSSRERSRPRSPVPEPQLTPIPMSDGDDDQPPQDGRQRQRTRSRDRVYLHAQAPQEPRFQPMVIQEPVTVPDEDPAVVNPSLPSAGPSPSAVQRRNKGPDCVSEHLHMPASSLNLLYLLLESSRSSLCPFKVRMRIQQP